MRVAPTFETINLLKDVKTTSDLKRILDSRNEDINECVVGTLVRPVTFIMPWHDEKRYHLTSILLECGLDITKKSQSGHTILDSNIIRMLLDMGVPLSEKLTRMDSGFKSNWEYAKSYNTIVQSRISTCRQVLLALIRTCRRSKLRPAQRGVILEIAKQVWRQRGGEGCGARGAWMGFRINYNLKMKKRVAPDNDTIDQLRCVFNITELNKFVETTNIDLNDYINGDWTRGSMLYCCLWRRYSGMAKLLIQYGVDLEKKCGIEQKTILHESILLGDTIFIELLLDANADIHAIDGLGRGVYYYMIHSRCLPVIQMVLDAGAKIPIYFNLDSVCPIMHNHVKKYERVVFLRIQSCRKALLTLIRVCKRSKSLWGLRGVILEIAKQVWTTRGPFGCGPRGHEWN
jgi:hypothetical protein